MGALDIGGGRTTIEEEPCSRPTEPVPVSIPREAYPSTRPPDDSKRVPLSIHEAQTVPPPAAPPKPKPQAPQIEGLEEIDDAWD